MSAGREGEGGVTPPPSTLTKEAEGRGVACAVPRRTSNSFPLLGRAGARGGAVGRRVQVQKIHLHRPAWGGNADQITTHLGIKGFPEVE